MDTPRSDDALSLTSMQVVELKRKLEEERDGYRRKLQSYQEGQQRQAQLVQKLQSKVSSDVSLPLLRLRPALP